MQRVAHSGTRGGRGSRGNAKTVFPVRIHHKPELQLHGWLREEEDPWHLPLPGLPYRNSPGVFLASRPIHKHLFH